jgi:hypothetical protein
MKLLLNYGNLIKILKGTVADLWLNYGYLNLNLKWNYGRTMAELLQFKFR